MPESRRRLLMTLVGGAGVLAIRWQAPRVRPAPQPRPSPNTPNPNFPPGLNGPQVTGPDKKAIDRQNQQEIRADVSKLYEIPSVA
jgi:hypothetical protein